MKKIEGNLVAPGTCREHWEAQCPFCGAWAFYDVRGLGALCGHAQGFEAPFFIFSPASEPAEDVPAWWETEVPPPPAVEPVVVRLLALEVGREVLGWPEYRRNRGSAGKDVSGFTYFVSPEQVALLDPRNRLTDREALWVGVEKFFPGQQGVYEEALVAGDDHPGAMVVLKLVAWGRQLVGQKVRVEIQTVSTREEIPPNWAVVPHCWGEFWVRVRR